MEKELRESELKFRKVFNGSMDGKVLFDNQFRIIDANPLASRILGMPDEELRAYTVPDILSLFDIENAGVPARKIDLEGMDNEIPFLLSSERQPQTGILLQKKYHSKYESGHL